jgi:hypothetical protein
MLTQQWREVLRPDGHGLTWRVANVALFVLALVAALAVIVGVFVGMLWLMAQGSS